MHFAENRLPVHNVSVSSFDFAVFNGRFEPGPPGNVPKPESISGVNLTFNWRSVNSREFRVEMLAKPPPRKYNHFLFRGSELRNPFRISAEGGKIFQSNTTFEIRQRKLYIIAAGNLKDNTLHFWWFVDRNLLRQWFTPTI